MCEFRRLDPPACRGVKISFIESLLTCPAMNLAFGPPLAPMLAKAADELPRGDGWLYEPKWDGFRTLVFRDGAEIYLQSRDEKPMNRYFPELVSGLPPHLPERCILDGETVIAGPNGLDFEALLLRIHPAASRVAMLAKETPCSFVAFDVLGARRRGSARHAAGGAPAAARGGARPGGGPALPHACDTRPRRRRRLVRPLRGRRARRGHRQAHERRLPPRRAHDAEDQARAHRRLRRRRVPLAQERPRHDGGLAPPRALRRRRHAPPRRRHVVVHDGDAARSRSRSSSPCARTPRRGIPGSGSPPRRIRRRSRTCSGGRA